jgi:predicted TIM-barrel fold metal-dependent hydrolase
MQPRGGGVVTPDMEATELEGIELMLLPSRNLGYPVFDVDNHLYETRDALTKFLPSQYEGIIKYIEINGRVKLAIDDRITDFIPNPTFEKVAPPGGQNTDPHQRRSVRSPEGFFHPEARLRLMHEMGIDRALLFPTLAGTFEQRLLHDLPATHAVAHAFNRWLLEHWTYSYEDAIFAAPIVLMSILDESLRELDFVIENGARAIWVRPGPVPGYNGPRSFASPEFDPFWRRAQESGVVIAMHQGDVGYHRYVNVWEGKAGQEHRPFASAVSPGFRLLCNDYSVAIDACASIIGHGLATRFPDLKFIPTEFHPWAGPFILKMMRAYDAAPEAFEEDPLLTFKRSIFVHAFQEREPSALIELIGVDNVLFGSDFPHQEGMNDPLAYSEYLQGLSDEDTAKIMGGNLARLMGVE